MGPTSTRLEMIRAGVERALCPRVAILDVSELSSFAGAAGLALELLDEDVDLVAAQVVGTRRLGPLPRGRCSRSTGRRAFSPPGSSSPSEVRGHRADALVRPTRVCGQARSAACELEARPRCRPTGCRERRARLEMLARRWAGAVTSAWHHASWPDASVARSRRANTWKASLGRLLEAETLAAHTRGAASTAARRAPTRVASAALPRQRHSRPADAAALDLRDAIQKAANGRGQGAPAGNAFSSSRGMPMAIKATGRRRRGAFLCSDAIGTSMAGPAIRSIELARVLAATRPTSASRLALGEGLSVRSSVPAARAADATVDELLALGRLRRRAGSAHGLAPGGPSERPADRGRSLRPDAPRGARERRSGSAGAVHDEPAARPALARRLLLLRERAPARLLARDARRERTHHAGALRGGSRPERADRRRAVRHPDRAAAARRGEASASS